MTCEVLKHLPVLQQLLEATQLVEQGRGLTQPVALVLAYELLFGEGVRPTGPAERAVLQRRVRSRERACAVCKVESRARPGEGVQGPAQGWARCGAAPVPV